METGLLHAHGGLRYIVLLCIIGTIVLALISNSKKVDNPAVDKFRLFSVILTHLQVLLGFVVYFLASGSAKAFLSDPGGSMGIKELRFFGMEHALMMIIAVVLITIGSAKAKRKTTFEDRNKTLITFFSIALLIIFIMIPWNFLPWNPNRGF